MIQCKHCGTMLYQTDKLSLWYSHSNAECVRPAWQAKSWYEAVGKMNQCCDVPAAEGEW